MSTPEGDFFQLFGTPVVAIALPGMAEINAELSALFLAEEKAVPSWQRANVGGWHSPPDLTKRRVPALHQLMRATVDRVTGLVHTLAAEAGAERVPAYRYAVTAWAMVMREHHYVSVHDHGDAHWSTAYYVDAGDDMPPPSGRLTFLDPRRGARIIPGLELFPSNFEVAARTGTLVIFPGWLQHHVHAYRGQRPRICISSNLTMDPLPPGS